MPISSSPLAPVSTAALRWSVRGWLLIAAGGQAAFIGFILLFYGVRTVTGNFAGWNDKPLIDGYIAGDRAGNAVFAAHVLIAALVTFLGLMQLVPAIRRRAPAVHRWSGRVFLSLAVFMALSGIWLSLSRGTYLSVVSAVAILLDAVLILLFTALAWRAARQRRFEMHRAWALRTFMVASGVWFLRVGLMGWVVLNQGPVGMTKTMSGPADIVLAFGSYLIPLAVLELYLVGERSQRSDLKLLAAGVIVLAALYTAVGVFGTTMLMWAPYVT
ncbi:DUF2306 domain-containing protein [Caulobacter sp. NIBR1757]|uniref:DUF2306 domain-containing protein n=1 Tax=Caulobacter sp. NIBR1757 TaxID=3016000 RepID=UPI0022F08B1C|nr:DUF2306 domain-containing protein [Caulobacter sp. NIBR1757]WGM39659.1 hypothetical protein AMEJIAPC_02584 [Caulobacter sp. NIBR1757]